MESNPVWLNLSPSLIVAQMKSNISKQETGGAGERRAAALLTIAVCAQTSHGTMAEDGGKVDLKLSFRSVLCPDSVITAHCQVKSGPSFRVACSKEGELALSVDSETLSALAEGTQPALLAWVSPKPLGRVYWQVIPVVRKLKATVKIPKCQFVTPAMRIDLSRVHAFRSSQSRSPVINLPSLPDRSISTARDGYKELKECPVKSPIMGNILFTRSGWRHVTRASRSKQRRQNSFELIPYLRTLLRTSPDRLQVVKQAPEVMGSQTQETREVILSYKKAIKKSEVYHDVLIRLIERINYPRNWERFGVSPSEVSVSVSAKSWWCKPSKETSEKGCSVLGV
jgi:hypothetical protein